MASMQEVPPGYDPATEPKLIPKPKTKSAKRNERKKEKRQQVFFFLLFLFLPWLIMTFKSWTVQWSLL